MAFGIGMTLIAGLVLSVTGHAADGDSNAATPLSYRVALDEASPLGAQLSLRNPPDTLFVARGGNPSSISNITCGSRTLELEEERLNVPAGCSLLRWRVRFVDMEAGVDASLPPSVWDHRHLFWFIAERHGFLRPDDLHRIGRVDFSARWADGHTDEREFSYPSLLDPPFYAVIGRRPTKEYRSGEVRMPVWGEAPAFPWIDGLHGQVLDTWARWRRDVVAPGLPSPAAIDFAWLKSAADAEYGYNASAGQHAIGAQIMLRPNDPEAQVKARAVIGSSAAHEGFHSIIGATGRGWPTWVNESLANYFALEAASRFLGPNEMAFLDQLYSDADVHQPVLEAQRRYDESPDEYRFVFYSRGARFWREIEGVLDSPTNESGRVAALIQSSRGFEGIDLNDANALAGFLDRHSRGRAGPIVLRHLAGAPVQAALE